MGEDGMGWGGEAMLLRGISEMFFFGQGKNK